MVTRIDGREYLNPSYNYLGLAGHPAVNKAAKEAIDRYGTLGLRQPPGGGRAPHPARTGRSPGRTLRRGRLHRVRQRPRHQRLHRSDPVWPQRPRRARCTYPQQRARRGQLSSGQRRSFRTTIWPRSMRCSPTSAASSSAFIVEGHYSMDGDVPDLPRLVEIKRRHKAFLMVDEAHALGVLGETGKGSHEQYGVRGKDVDIWMGTLSKTLAGCRLHRWRAGIGGTARQLRPVSSTASAFRRPWRRLRWPRSKSCKKNPSGLPACTKTRSASPSHGQRVSIPVLLAGLCHRAHHHRCSRSRPPDSRTALRARHQRAAHRLPGGGGKAARLRFFLSSLHTESNQTNRSNAQETCIMQHYPLIPVILCGGAWVRAFGLSRARCTPSPFHSLKRWSKPTRWLARRAVAGRLRNPHGHQP